MTKKPLTKKCKAPKVVWMLFPDCDDPRGVRAWLWFESGLPFESRKEALEFIRDDVRCWMEPLKYVLVKP